jgi:branched-chain amino acid transport system ATP-binding protein
VSEAQVKVLGARQEFAPLLAVDGVKVSYGAIQALRGVTLKVGKGEVVALIGANGAGKTSTLRAVSGMLKPVGGRISFGGEDTTGAKAHTLVPRGMAHAPEGRGIFPNLTVLENLELGAYLRNDADGIAADMEKSYVLFPKLKERRKQLAGTLSGGEQQMLAIARALLSRPKLLLLDEPSLGLAPIIIQQIFEIIRQINAEQRTTIFLVEQNAMQALKLAHRGYVMENGRITLVDEAAKLLDNAEVKRAYLGI